MVIIKEVQELNGDSKQERLVKYESWDKYVNDLMYYDGESITPSLYDLNQLVGSTIPREARIISRGYARDLEEICVSFLTLENNWVILTSTLVGEVKEESKSNERFKIRCVSTPFPEYFTVGKVYEVVDGIITYDNGSKNSNRCYSLEIINERFDTKFESVEEIMEENVNTIDILKQASEICDTKPRKPAKDKASESQKVPQNHDFDSLVGEEYVVIYTQRPYAHTCDIDDNCVKTFKGKLENFSPSNRTVFRSDDNKILALVWNCIVCMHPVNKKVI